jgi:hypothetical protein
LVCFAEDRADFKAYVSDFTESEAETFVEVHGKQLSNAQRQRLVGLWADVARRPGELKNLVESPEEVEANITAVQNEALECLENHLRQRPDDEAALRVLAASPYDQGLPRVQLLRLVPPAGCDASGPTVAFYQARVVTTDTKSFRFCTIAVHTAARQHFEQRPPEIPVPTLPLETERM